MNLLPDGEFSRGSPVRHDIVIPLRRGRDLDKFKNARRPFIHAFDPQTGPQFVTAFEVLILLEIARPLQQAKPLQIIRAETTQTMLLLRVEERAPKQFVRRWLE